MMNLKGDKFPKRNHEHYMDPTPYEAMTKYDREKERVSRLIRTIFSICELAGFDVDGRIILIDKKSGKVWR